MSTTLASIIDRKHLSAIADAIRTLLQSAHAYLDDVSNGDADGLRNTLYREWECSHNKLRRCMAAGGVFKLRHQLLATAEGQKAHDALRRLARNVGEYQQAPSVAGAVPPLPTEASTARLAVVLTLLEEHLRALLQGCSATVNGRTIRILTALRVDAGSGGRTNGTRFPRESFTASLSTCGAVILPAITTLKTPGCSSQPLHRGRFGPTRTR